MRATHHARDRCAQNADHLAHNTPLSAFFTEVVCVLGAAPPQAATSPPPTGGNYAIQASDTPTTRRKKASHGAKPPSPPAWRAPRNTGPGCCARVGGRAWPGFETTHRSATQPHWCGGRRRDLPRCRWAAAGTGRAIHSDLAPLAWRAPEGPAAVPVGGGGAWPGFETTRHPSAPQPHWCGGRRRDRRARAGFEARRRTK